jgi:hypothetical protein
MRVNYPNCDLSIFLELDLYRFMGALDQGCNAMKRISSNISISVLMRLLGKGGFTITLLSYRFELFAEITPLENITAKQPQVANLLHNMTFT